MNYCISKNVADALKEAFKKGDISMEGLYGMTSKDRHSTFAKYSTDDLAQFINANFEKAMVTKQKDSLQKWAKATFTATEKQSKPYESIMNKIEKLEKQGVLDPESEHGFLQDLVADKMGITVTADEVSEITKRATKLEELSTKLDPEIGVQDIEYWKAHKELDDYIDSLTPVHKMKVATSTIGRGTMLFSVKSPLTNIISNTVMGAVQSMERRIASKTYRGLNGDFALKYIKKVNKIYQESGFDISRLDAEWSSQRRLGEQITHSQGEGLTRKVGRFYEDKVFKQLMGAPDVASSSIQFADSVDLISTKIAKGDKAKALEIFKDAVTIQPKTPEGALARAQGIADARYATYTNNSGYSDVAMGIRNLLNKASKDLRLGDQLMPFVKTPANVVSTALDTAGVGAFKGIYKLPGAMKALKAGNGAPMQEVVRDFTRTGLGLALASVLAYSINPEDFVGDYDSLTQKERDLATLKNAPYNSIKIGDKYISLDYFGPLGAAFVGIMYGRKYGKNLPEKVGNYTKGAAGQLLRFPGLTEVGGIIDGVTKAISQGDMGKTAEGLTAEAIAFINSRVVPGLVSDFAKGLDSSVRVAEKPFEKVAAGIPGLRQMLPEKIDKTTGQPVKSEDFLSTILFGSRVKTAKENLVVNEINRLYGENAAPAITDIERSSPRIQALKTELGDKFTDALEYYGKQYGTESTKLINSLEYKKLYDEDKMKALNSVRSKAIEDMILKFTPEKTPEQLKQIQKNQAKEFLTPYFSIEENVWKGQDPRLYATYKEIKKLESGNAEDRAKAKKWQSQYPQILNLRNQVAQIKKQMMADPRIKQAYEIYSAR
jgi:hypothetical protein